MEETRHENELNLAKIIQQACIKAAREGFLDASMSGLCREGAVEAAIGAIQRLDLEKIVNRYDEKSGK